jgi:hypothetical protein
MNWRRFATVAALCRTVVLPSWVVVWLAAFGSAGIENIDAASIVDRAPSLAADAESAVVLSAPATDNTPIVHADAATAGEAANATAAGGPVATREPELVGGTAASPQMPPPDTPPMQVATAPVTSLVKEDASSIEIFDECLAVDVCIDRYLWSLYQRTPKEDTIKVPEQTKVTVKRRGKRVTVTRTITRLVDEDFAWKDPKAAEKAGMPMADYVIGGMDRSFKVKLFHMLHAAEQAGLSPGITSAFRDDYRQSIASGLKAATNRSYHGGSFRGGYGHGLAADVVSVKGGTRDERWASSEGFWKWIDAHGKEFGVGRPYLDRDPPHVAPIDGKEYAAHSRGTKAAQAGPAVKKRNRLAARNHRSPTKPAKTARSSKVRTT